MVQTPRVYMSPPHMSGREFQYVQEVFDSNWIAPVGPHLTRFEQQFARKVGLRAAVALSSGTAALHLALRHLGLRPGDEVICSSFTFAASANPIAYEGARPVFLDCDAATWNMAPQLLADELADAAQRNKLPRAVIAVDLLGQSADMDAILQIAGRYEIPVIEDAAEVLGGSYKNRAAGSSGWVNAFSFNGNKIITTSGGGMLASDDEQAIEHVRHLSTQAREPGPFYLHSEIGFNYRLSNVCAAIGLGQLEVLDERVARRKEINQFYRRHLGELPGISFMPIADYGEPNYWLTVIVVDPRQFGVDCEAVRLALEELNIESRRVWVPLHLQKAFAGCRYRGGKVAEQILAAGLCLPSGTAMSQRDLQRVVDCVRTLAPPA
jgi:pyridoxal phosphate-dependent aminotransferase EpsN